MDNINISEENEKSYLLKYPVFEKTKPYIWIKAIVQDQPTTNYRVSFSPGFFKKLNIEFRIFREDLNCLYPRFKYDIDQEKHFVMVLPKQKDFFVNKIETQMGINSSEDYLKIDKYQFPKEKTNIIILNRVVNKIAENPCLIFASEKYTWEEFYKKIK